MKEPRYRTSFGCLPLKQMYAEALVAAPSRWPDVQNSFLTAMWAFDQNYATGLADQGDNQNGKGDFFNDLIVLLLQNCSRRPLSPRPNVPGLIFRKHKLDVAFPSLGSVEILVETKAAGAPKGVRNPAQKNPGGRPGSADLDKRLKEVGLKTIDLKAEWARSEGRGRGPTADFVSWLRESAPKCFLFLAIRIVDEVDLKRTIEFAHAANMLMDGVGLFAYHCPPRGARYAACEVPTQLELDRVLSRVCTALASSEGPPGNALGTP